MTKFALFFTITAGAMLAQTQMFTATSVNVAGAPEAVRIDVLRWSTEAEQQKIFEAWTLTGAPARSAAEPGAGKGKGGGKGGGQAPPRPATPEASLAAALEAAPIVGHLWTSESAGYAIHYAVSEENGNRILLIVDRKLGENNGAWKSAQGAPSAYPFSVIELRLNRSEGKASVTGRIAAEGKLVALENYAALPVVLKDVKRAVKK